MKTWTYVGEAFRLRRAAEDVLWAWDVLRDSEAVSDAITTLRQAVQAEKRYAWTDDYYDTKGDK